MFIFLCVPFTPYRNLQEVMTVMNNVSYSFHSHLEIIGLWYWWTLILTLRHFSVSVAVDVKDKFFSWHIFYRMFHTPALSVGINYNFNHEYNVLHATQWFADIITHTCTSHATQYLVGFNYTFIVSIEGYVKL